MDFLGQLAQAWQLGPSSDKKDKISISFLPNFYWQKENWTYIDFSDFRPASPNTEISPQTLKIGKIWTFFEFA